MSSQPFRNIPPRKVDTPFESCTRVGRTPGKREVFRALIEWEAASGSLTPGRRARLLRYAAQLGLSATAAGELIRACADAPTRAAEPRGASLRLRLAEAESEFPCEAPRRLRAALPLLLGGMLLAAWIVLLGVR